MEKLISDGFSLTDAQINSCSDRADEIVDGITGFMYGCVISMLKKVWKYGEDLNKWHNQKYGVENTSTTVNPAIITISEA